MIDSNKEVFYANLLRGSVPLTLSEELVKVQDYKEGIKVIQKYRESWFPNCIIDYDDFIETYTNIKGRIILNNKEIIEHSLLLNDYIDIEERTLERHLHNITGNKPFKSSTNRSSYIYIVLYTWYKVLGYKFYEDDMLRIRKYKNKTVAKALVKTICDMCNITDGTTITNFLNYPNDKFIRMALNGKPSKELYMLYCLLISKQEIDPVSYKDFYTAVSKDLFHLYNAARVFAIKVCKRDTCKTPKKRMKDFSVNRYSRPGGHRYYMMNTCKECYYDRREDKQRKAHKSGIQSIVPDASTAPVWGVVKR